MQWGRLAVGTAVGLTVRSAVGLTEDIALGGLAVGTAVGLIDTWNSSGAGSGHSVVVRIRLNKYGHISGAGGGAAYSGAGSEQINSQCPQQWGWQWSHQSL